MCITASGLVKRFNGITALNGISFRIECGEAAALLGPNGAGKTTTLRILAGLLRPDSGSAHVCNFDVQRQPRNAKACLGYLPEDAVPFLNLTVRENLEYVAVLRELSDSVIDETIKLLGLEDLADRTAGSLSRGNRQRLAIALAIMHRPRVLLLDEPLNYLDIPTQENVIRLFRDLNANGSTLLVSTHVMSIAERLTSKVIVISKGVIVWQGTMNELKEIAASAGERIEEVVARLMK
ncbi:MAG: ABC transporter ATP-binding protein [Vulcanisaeta sp.]|jgi:ABC-2 type transport system ATP-binding protein|uniref:ABC transporter ATP-binding protein n=1 Tax=Vulcanisaeta sp. TaxID=2020871 RepID=UPI003D0E6351